MAYQNNPHMKYYIIYIAVLMTAFITRSVYAETVTLKSGKIVQGKVLEQTDVYLVMEISGLEIKYYLDEITSIDGKVLASVIPGTQPPDSSQNIPGLEQTFQDADVGYSLGYPSSWELVPDAEKKKGCSVSLRSKKISRSEPAVYLSLQQGNYSEDKLKDKNTMSDLLSLLPLPRELKQESADAVTIHQDSWLFMRYTQNIPYTLTNVDEKGNSLNGFMTSYYDYYFFSPVFVSQGKNKRFFLIEVYYLKFNPLAEDSNSSITKTIIEKHMLSNDRYNENVDTRSKEARMVVDSFRYRPSDSSPEQAVSSAVEKKASQVPSVSVKLSLGKLKEAQDYLQRGRNYLIDKKYQDAIIQIQKALAINPQDAFAYVSLGEAYGALGNNKQAVEYFRKAMDIIPNYLEAYAGLGYVYIASGQQQEAVAVFQKATEINPKYAEGYRGLGYIYSRLGQYDPAITQYQKALKIDPNNVYYNKEIGFLYVSLGQYREAITYFQKAIKLNPEYAEGYTGLGFVYYSLGQNQNAKEHFQKARQLFRNKQDMEGVKIIEEYLKKIP
ncbi:MAG: tetratricopeptide repeat protein [Candidatus Omnitrophota bacterium]